MESVNSQSEEAQATVSNATPPAQDGHEQWLIDRFESFLPRIQEEWPDLAKQTLEATKGSFDELVKVISNHTGKTNYGVQEQLEELIDSASDHTKNLANNLEPLEKQLEELLDDLNNTLRPRIEKPIRQRPLLAIGVAASIGIFLGILLSGGKSK